MHSSPFRALGHYRVLPQLTGWKALVIAFAARAPYAMLPLGVMTAVTASTGSVAQGGAATATTAISTAIAGPLIGKWADRKGQFLPLRLLTPINALALLLLFLAVQSATVGLALYLACMAVGFTSLPIGSFTRSRWIHQTNTPQELNAALSYESMADELVFVLGPALVGIAATTAFASAPLFLAFILVATAGIAFALLTPKTGPATPSTTKQGPGVGKVLLAVTPAIIAMTGIGILFGTTQAATTVRSELLGHQGIAGLVYAAMGVGSAVMAILTVAIPERINLPTRLLIGGLGIATAMSLVALVNGLVFTAILLTIAGFFVGPAMVTAFTLAESLAPRGGIAIAMTSMQSSVVIGVSIGSSMGGVIAQNFSDKPTFLASAGAGMLVALVGFILNIRQLSKRR
ncbi:MFS transporter [Gleimia europaea]|uniref:Major facilitator superfamily (MFS) profile domain-containing protein n=1 Tax=Gleimia europaea ACS-120-V-Col10b TaxID=883069 RepID=A0A9W5RDP2_9ACTO|nr:MFS transporter [Gleimia europaea]EPD30564.1 hypothetical protein HMPREF9238_00310 [Gleimia europaea ACS-120-V-Col10b]